MKQTPRLALVLLTGTSCVPSPDAPDDPGPATSGGTVPIEIWALEPGGDCFAPVTLQGDATYWEGWPDGIDDVTAVYEPKMTWMADGRCLFWPRYFFERVGDDPAFWQVCPDTGDDHCGCTLNTVRELGFCDGSSWDGQAAEWQCWPWCP